MILLKSKKEFNIGIVTIGKSPRLDIESELQKTIDCPLGVVALFVLIHCLLGWVSSLKTG